MRFQYFEIRPCVDDGENTRSFLGEPQYHEGIGGPVCTPEAALAEAQAYRQKRGGDLFWTLYGRDEEGLAQAIGDFTTFDDAHEIMNAILAPMAAARDLIRDGKPHWKAPDCEKAADDLDDVINQSSNKERL